MSSGNAAILVLILASWAIIKPVRASAEWNYDSESLHGPANWSHSYPTCGGDSQSPINIPDVVVHTTSFSGLSLQSYSNTPTQPFTLSNNGHSAVITVSPKAIYAEGGGLTTGRYYLEQLHFHWGTNEKLGSEHQVNSKSYPLEIHMVHFHEAYNNVSHAVSSGTKTALAVLGVFVDVSSDQSKVSTGFANFIGNLREVTSPGNSTPCQQFALKELLPSSANTFYRYNGSLTTPGCSEVVIWTVFSDPIYTTSNNLAEFRKLRSADGGALEHNYRPPQPLNSRTVYHQMGTASLGQQQMSLTTVILSAIFFMKISHKFTLQF